MKLLIHFNNIIYLLFSSFLYLSQYYYTFFDDLEGKNLILHSPNVKLNPKKTKIVEMNQTFLLLA